MSYESIWTEDELLEAIRKTKESLQAASVQKVNFDGGGHEMATVGDLRAHLKYLQDELNALRGKGGMVSVAGRPVR